MCFLTIILTFFLIADGQPLSFASYYGKHMVLQQAPRAACVWGFADVTLVGQNVTVTLMSSDGKVVEETLSVVSARAYTLKRF